MGILDDAIRQHLELKRQHGAPEEELQRQEEEALGPARRDVAPAEPSGGDGEVELETTDEAPAAEAASEQETELFEPEDREPALDQPEASQDEIDEPVSTLDEPESEPDTGPDMAFERSAGPDAPFEPDEEPEPEGVPEPDAVPPSPAPFDAETAFQEFGERYEPDEDEDEEPEAESESEDEPDVLEDTPDFLQETPEHDRLWFEQKPPRDFDFD
jgi:hypothetical protein